MPIMPHDMNSRPGLVLGTMDYGTHICPERAFALLDHYVAAGGTWLDTANCYSFWADPAGVGGASETVLGQWLRARPGVRDQVKIATKVRQNPLVPHRWPETAEGLSAQAISDGLAASLQRLGVDSVDLLWAHAEDRTVPLEETVEAFADLVDKGLAMRVGAANHETWRVERARNIARQQGRTPWTALQLRHSLVQPRPGATLPEAGHKLMTPGDLDYAHEEGLEIWAYTPLLHGGYSRPDKPFSPAYEHPGTTGVLAVLDAVAGELGATRHQVVLAWLVAQGITPLVGVSTIDQLDEVLGAGGIVLTEEHMNRFAESR